MSVQTELDRIIGAVESAHEKVIAKGGTSSRPYLVGNLESAIDSIPEAVAPKLQEKSVTPSTSAQTVTPDNTYDGLSKVNVGKIPDDYIIPSGTKAITENGTHDVTQYESATVNVPSEDLSAEIATQKQLISDIQTALEGKAAGGSGGGSSEPETVSVNMLRGSNLSTLRVVYAFTQYKDGAFAFNHSNYFASSTTTPTVLNNVLKGSFIVVYSNNKSYKVSGVTVTDGLTLVVMIDGTAIIGVNADCPAEGATITANSASA